MTTVDTDWLRRTAQECVTLVGSQFGRTLDWSLASLTQLDLACADLLADGPLQGERLELWWRLIGSYAGEVLVRSYDGLWIAHEEARGAYAVSVRGIIGFPFRLTNRILGGEEGKSFTSFGRAVPVIAEHSKHSEHSERPQ
jgi:hypothetical protein